MLAFCFVSFVVFKVLVFLWACDFLGPSFFRTVTFSALKIWVMAPMTQKVNLFKIWALLLLSHPHNWSCIDQVDEEAVMGVQNLK